MRRSQSVYLNRDRSRENWREYEDRRKISDLDDDKKKKKSANNRAHFTGKYHRGLFVVQWTKYPADEDCAVDESVAHNATFTNQKALRRELRGQQKKKEETTESRTSKRKNRRIKDL